jgi:hypothetical protein
MIEEVREFLGLFEGDPLEPEKRLRALAVALDKLSCGYHQTRRVHSDSLIEPPNSDSKDEALISKYFPDFGFYSIVDPLADTSQTPMVADAADDLRDIRRDLLEVVWRWENVGKADAIDSFCESYEIHWGRFHLPGLRQYVSAKLLSG